MIKLILAAFSIFIGSALSATTTTDVFKKYPNKIFVESGSYRGDGIQQALDAGFEEIYSVEIAPHLFIHCQQRFKNNPNVHLYLGNSSIVFKKILSKLDRPATFWLDGHYSWGDTGKGDSNTPLLLELNLIAEHPIKTHTILIDDVRQFGAMEFDFINLDTIMQKLYQINPGYTLSYEDGYQKNDVLVANPN